MTSICKSLTARSRLSAIAGKISGQRNSVATRVAAAFASWRCCGPCGDHKHHRVATVEQDCGCRASDRAGAENIDLANREAFSVVQRAECSSLKFLPGMLARLMKVSARLTPCSCRLRSNSMSRVWAWLRTRTRTIRSIGPVTTSAARPRRSRAAGPEPRAASGFACWSWRQGRSPAVTTRHSRARPGRRGSCSSRAMRSVTAGALMPISRS